MVVPLGSKVQAAPSGNPSTCSRVTDAETLVACITWWCGAGMCRNPAQYEYLMTMLRGALGKDYLQIMDRWSPVSMNATVGNGSGSIIGDLAWRLSSLQSQVRPMVSTAAQAANNLATATKPMIPMLMAAGAAATGAASTAVNTAGAAAVTAGNAVAGAGAATVVAGGVAVVGGAAVVTLTGMLAYESVRWRYASVESERLEVQACQAVYTTNQQLYNHFLQPGTAAPSRGQCQSFSDFFLRCSKHIVGGPALMQPPGCI